MFKFIKLFVLILIALSISWTVYAQENEDEVKKESCEKLNQPKTQEDLEKLRKCIKRRKNLDTPEKRKLRAKRSFDGSQRIINANMFTNNALTCLPKPEKPCPRKS